MPAVLYSLIVPLRLFPMQRLESERAKPTGALSPVTSD
jgi:hypothetical protein